MVFFVDWFSDFTGWNVPFMMSGFYLFLACCVIMVVVSLIKGHQHTEQSIKLVWKHPLESLETKGWRGIGNYKFLSALLFVVIILLYIKFK